MTIPYWLDSHSKPTEEADVVVIGGGVAGVACAYWLTRHRPLKVALIESNQIASGASGRNGGFVLRGIVAYYNQTVKSYGRETARWILRFNEDTQRYLEDFAHSHKSSFGFDRCGSYLLACSLEELEALEESAQLMLEDGFDLEYLKSDPIDRGFYGAIHNPRDVALDPARLVRALASASSATIYEGEQVFRIDQGSSGRTAVVTDKRTIAADRVLVTLNAYLPLLMPAFMDYINPVRGQIVVTRPLKESIVDKLCYANYGYEYFRQLPDRRLLMGGCREPFRHDEVGYADVLTPAVQQAIHHYIRDHFPEIAGAPIDYRWSGLMGFTRDGLPLLGELQDRAGVFFVTGCNSHGMGYSMALSRLLVEVAMDGASPQCFDAFRESGIPRAAAVARL